MNIHPKHEIVAVARGYYALPILMALAKKGVVGDLLGDGVSVAELGGNDRNLNIVMTYLRNLGWVSLEGETYRATELGSKVLRRCGAFGILYSYRPYIRNLDELLFDAESVVHVHRDENVVGSGEAHVRKYFSRVKDIIENTQAKYILDVGCGDGTFMNYCRSVNPKLGFIGVDYSERALAVTRDKVSKDTILFQGNVSEPEITLQKVQQHGIDPADVLVSVWFIFHEVLGFADVNLTQMLQGYRKLTPKNGLIIGEIFDIPHEVLAHHHPETAVPEFNLFHDLSGQKLFSEAAWREGIEASGFTEKMFLGLDKLPMDDKDYFGSAVWHLA